VIVSGLPIILWPQLMVSDWKKRATGSETILPSFLSTGDHPLIRSPRGNGKS
jgi:hypothetical protein